jgi:hypothetical protein
MSGQFTRERHPIAVTRKRVVTSSPLEVCTRQSEFASSNCAAVTAVPNR